MVKAYEHNAGIIRHFGKHNKKKIEGFIQDFIQDFPFGRGGEWGGGDKSLCQIICHRSSSKGQRVPHPSPK